MAAIKRGKIYATKRTRLEEVIPLRVPYAVQIDICSACNMHCDFCVHSDTDAVKKAGIHWGIMSQELFKHIIDDMKNAWGDCPKTKFGVEISTRCRCDNDRNVQDNAVEKSQKGVFGQPVCGGGGK